MGIFQQINADQYLAQQNMSSGAHPRVTFFTLCNDEFFPALVGLLNSLRLIGHDDPIVVADCGLTAPQRELLASHCTLFELPSNRAAKKAVYKPFPFLLNPQGIVVMIDSDIIVTRSLNTVLALAAQGKICAFPDLTHDRWYSEWEELFGLRSAPRKQTYVNAGFVAFSASVWPELLERWWKACERLREHPAYYAGVPVRGVADSGDQDALNALLMSEFPTDALSLLPFDEQVLMGQFRRVRSTDARTLNCQYKGQQPLILHPISLPKPWKPDGVRFGGMVYLRFLRRLLTAPDVALNVPAPFLKIWLRLGVVSALACTGLAFANLSTSRAARLAGRLGLRSNDHF